MGFTPPLSNAVIPLAGSTIFQEHSLPEVVGKKKGERKEEWEKEKEEGKMGGRKKGGREGENPECFSKREVRRRSGGKIRGGNHIFLILSLLLGVKVNSITMSTSCNKREWTLPGTPQASSDALNEEPTLSSKDSHF